jgi:hypothetical protein
MPVAGAAEAARILPCVNYELYMGEALAEAKSAIARGERPHVGALLAADVEALVFAIPNRTDGAAGSVLQLAEHPGLRRRVKVVSGIRRDEVEELYAAATAK